MISSFLAIFTALFSVVNPFGAIPIFLALTHDLDNKTRRNQALKTSIYMIIILLVFFFAGKLILNFFGIRIEDIRIAGGILISITAFQLVLPGSHKGKPIAKEVREEGMEKDDISFTPMAMPVLSGPGAIAVIIGIFNETNATLEYINTVLSVILLAVFAYFILSYSEKIQKILGKAGMAALSRMMGFIVLAIGVSMIMNGLLPLLRSAA
jgi:multiple antibiotic resistance protein